MPSWSQLEFKDALTFNPNVVIIILGTNDTKPQNWKYADDYVADYVDMIGRFKSLPSEPNVSVIAGEIIPKIREVANKTGVPVIDLYTPLRGKEPLFPDKIHPNAEGAGIIASAINTALTANK